MNKSKKLNLIVNVSFVCVNLTNLIYVIFNQFKCGAVTVSLAIVATTYCLVQAIPLLVKDEDE